jgi:outer membrane receptor protein involved in Fe transport
MRTFASLGLRAALFTSVAGACFGFQPALAQDASIDEAEGGEADDAGTIIVTATKQGPQSLLDVPQSISAVGAEDLERSGAQGIADIVAKIPGLSAFGAGSNQTKIKLRGVSSASESEPQETVAVYLDDVPITGSGGTNNENGASPDLGLFDLNRIEVLKGPQGTLYGSGSLGGTVRYILNTPNLTEFEGRAQARISTTKRGSESYALDGVLNIPIVTDKVALRLAGSFAHNGGWLDNTAPVVGLGLTPTGTGRKDANRDDNWLVRATLEVRPVDEFIVRARYMHRQFDVKGENSVDTGRGDYTQPWKIEPFNKDNIDLYDLYLEYDAGAVVISSSTSYLDRDTLDLQDTNRFSQLLFTPASPSSTLINSNRQKDFTEELRVSFDTGGMVKGVVGLYYQDQTKDFTQDAPNPGLNDFCAANDGCFGAPAGTVAIPEFPTVNRAVVGVFPNVFQSVVPQDLEQVALFGELTFSLSDQLDVILGGRYFDLKGNFDYQSRGAFSTPGADARSGTYKEDGFNPKGTISYKPNEDTTLYATASKGFRAGGFNQPIPSTPQCIDELNSLGISNSAVSFDSDSLWNYEVGGKAKVAGGAVFVSGSAYYLNWSDVQVRRQLGCGFTFFSNAAKARSIGFEGAISARPAAGLSTDISISYVDAQLQKTLPQIGAKGDSLPGVPSWTIGFALDYERPLNDQLDWFGRFDASYVSGFNSTISPTDPLNRRGGDYALANLRLGISGFGEQGWSVALFANNLFDKRAVVGTQSNLFGDYEFINRPREIGLQANIDF